MTTMYKPQERSKHESYLKQIQARHSKPKHAPSYIRYTLSLAIKLAPRAAIASTALFILQCVYVVLRTPRLPPPPFSGVNFVKDGLVVTCDDKEVKPDGTSSIEPKADLDTSVKTNEFRMVLIGDSPVEGIGNDQHSSALCGQTAKAFANHVCKDTANNQRRYDHVRYWSYGKSGLTARGIEEEIVPLLHSTADCIRQSSGNTESEPAIHAIVLLCGVNNVLSPSTPSSFANEVSSLLASIRNHPSTQDTPILMLGLPDFSKLPFLPSWPMGWVLGMKGRRLQSALEGVIDDGTHPKKTAIVQIPEVQDVIGSRGYRRLDSSNILDKTAPANQFTERYCHPLLKYLGHDAINPNTVSSLSMNDFLCDDGFHPGKYGTTYIGSLLADAYNKLADVQ